MTNPEAPTLVVFCKRPALHQGKQRLAEQIGPEAALALAEMFLECALEDARAWPGPVVISPSDKSDLAWAVSLMPGLDRIVSQPEGNLGERLQFVDIALREEGHSEIVYIGTDAPVLNSKHYHCVQAAFSTFDVVLGRALDGGVTFMGSKRGWPDLESLPWSSGKLADALVQACKSAGFRVDVCMGGYDIDTKESLLLLRRDLKSDVRPERVKLGKWLEQNF